MTDPKDPTKQLSLHFAEDDMVSRGIETSIADGRLTISISVADLIRNARIGPGMEFIQSLPAGKVMIFDEPAFAESILRAMEHSDPEHGASFLYRLIDDAVELAIEKGWPGFVHYNPVDFRAWLDRPEAQGAA